jgi:hypothetical protein
MRRPCAARSLSLACHAACSAEHSQIELTKTIAIGDRFHLDDLSVRHCEFQNHQQLSARSHDDADFAVDECGLSRASACFDRALGDGRGVSDFRRPAASQDASDPRAGRCSDRAATSAR